MMTTNRPIFMVKLQSSTERYLVQEAVDVIIVMQKAEYGVEKLLIYNQATNKFKRTSLPRFIQQFSYSTVLVEEHFKRVFKAHYK